MASPILTTPRARPAKAFARPLRLVPRRLRRGLLIAALAVVAYFRHDGLSWSASMAFWLVLSLPPLVIAASSLIRTVGGAEAAKSILADQIASQVPSHGELITGLVDQPIELLSPAGAGSLLFLLFSGSRVFASMVTAVNKMWSHVPDEGFVRVQVLRLAMVLTIGGLLVASVLLQLGIVVGDAAGPVAHVAGRYVIPFLLVVGGLFLAYRVVPWHLASNRTALLAAILTAVLLRAFQVSFTFLLSGAIDYDTAFGSLAGIAILMTWAVVASSIVLLGAAFVATIDRRRPGPKPIKA